MGKAVISPCLAASTAQEADPTGSLNPHPDPSCLQQGQRGALVLRHTLPLCSQNRSAHVEAARQQHRGFAFLPPSDEVCHILLWKTHLISPSSALIPPSSALIFPVLHSYMMVSWVWPQEETQERLRKEQHQLYLLVLETGGTAGCAESHRKLPGSREEDQGWG